jgi:outer membrane protein
MSFAPVAIFRRMAVAAGAAAVLSACAATTHLPSLASEQVAPGTSSSPAAPWTPPQSSIPPRIPSEGPALPNGYQTGMPLALAQVIDLALTNNPSTRTAWLQARAAEAQLGSRQSAYYPGIDLDAQIGRSNQANLGGLSTTLSTTLGPSVALSYLLLDFGGRAAQVEEGRQTLVAADFTHNAVIQGVILRVEQAYYDVLNVKALVDAQQATLKELQTNVDAADARHNAGVATIADVLQARTALSQARLNLDSLEGSLRAAEGTLATSMGLPVTAQFDLGRLPASVPAQQVAAAVDQLLDQAQHERPDLQSERALALRARARVRDVRSSYLPSFSLTGSAGRTYYGTSAGAPQATIYAAGLAMRFPLFTGFRNTYDVRGAQLDEQIANENVRSLEEQIGLQVWTSYFGVKTAAQRVQTSRDLLASAQQSFDVASGRYREGVGSILDLLTAEAALENARAQEVQGRADWLLSVAQLSHDLGVLTPSNAVANPAAGVPLK